MLTNRRRKVSKRLVKLWMRRFLVAPAAIMLAALITAPAHANATIGDGTPGSCTTEAAANAFDSAVAAGGVINFNCGPNPVTIIVNTNVTDKTVVVNGGGLVTLSGDQKRQIFYVLGGGNLTLNDLNLIDGDAFQGGGIYVDSAAQATINRSFLTSNRASGAGGGVYNKGTLVIDSSSLDRNRATGAGGTIYNDGGTVTINDSYLISSQAQNGGGVYNKGALVINSSLLGSNQATVNGGAIYNDGGAVTINDSYLISSQAQNGGGVYTVNGQLTIQRTGIRSSLVGVNGGGLYIAGPTAITNSTFSNNTANSGGGLYSTANTTVLNATFNENRANLGGAIFRIGGTFTIKNTIVAGDGSSLNCDGPTLESQGRNIVSDNSCVSNPSSVGDLLSTDPKLGVWFGAPLRGYIPNADSPALDYAQGCPSVDQRGSPRPIGAGCDVGAIERDLYLYLPLVRR